LIFVSNYIFVYFALLFLSNLKNKSIIAYKLQSFAKMNKITVSIFIDLLSFCINFAANLEHNEIIIDKNDSK